MHLSELRVPRPARGIPRPGCRRLRRQYADDGLSPGVQAREDILFDYLSDHELALTRTLRLPTFEFPMLSGGPRTLIRRMSWYVDAGRVERVWYPAFPPDRNAATVLAWLRRR